MRDVFVLGPLMRRPRPRQLQRSALISIVAIVAIAAAVAGSLAGVYDDELAGQQGTVVDGHGFWMEIVQLEPVSVPPPPSPPPLPYIPCQSGCESPTQNFTFRGAEFSVFLFASGPGVFPQLEGVAHWNNGSTWFVDLGAPPEIAYTNSTASWPAFLGPGDQIGLRWNYLAGLALLVRA